MIIEAIIIGIIIGLIRKGKVSRLEYVKINLSPLILLALISYVAIIIVNLGLLPIESNLYYVFLIATYALIIIVMAFNLDKKFMFLPLIGVMMNFICMCVNSFRIPIKSDIVLKFYGTDMSSYLLNNKIKFFIPAENATLNGLGKIFTFGDYYFYNVIFSIGDVFIAIGIVLVIQALMTDKYLKTKDALTLSKSLFKKSK